MGSGLGQSSFWAGSMRTLSLIVGCLLSSVALAGCGPSVTPAPVQADVVRISALYPQATLAQLERGHQLYLSRCASCHAPVAPQSFSPEAWVTEVDEMSERALLGNEEILVVQYLVARSLHDSPQGKL